MIQHILIFLLLISCESEVQTTLNNNATNTDTIILNTSPVSYDLTPANTYKNIESIITLNYTDSELDLATSCTTSNLSNLTISSPCTCSLGTCTVGITGTLNYIGLASFDYSVTANNMISNTSSATFSINNIGASLTDQWIKVPANAGGMGLSAFYIMKYEAKGWNDLNANSDIDTGELDADGMGISLVSNKAVSVEDSTPWRMIDANDAASACESLGANYHLVSNDEWIAIARDLENVDTNWTGNSIGSGCIFRGNSGEATIGDGNNFGDSCGYNATTDPESGNSRDIRASLRLSNGSTIFDLAGNLMEWVDWDKDTIGFQVGPNTCASSWVELSTLSCPALQDSDYNTTSGTLTSTEGIGLFYGGAGSAILRSGRWVDQFYGGIFMMHLNNPPTFIVDYIGFRCVYRE